MLMTKPDVLSDNVPEEVSWKPFWAGLVVYVVALGAYLCFAWQRTFGIADATEKTTAGLFGDAFGAFNAAFSGLGFVGLAFTIYLQHRQLKLQQHELALQREELRMTREELARSTLAQQESEKALRGQLRVMSLSSRLPALTALIKWEETHIREAHHITNIEWSDIGALEKQLSQVEQAIRSGQADGLAACHARNLQQLIAFRKDLAAIYDELRAL